MNQPTRTNLLLLKERLHAVLNCTGILKGRRQALIKEFLAISRPLMRSREEVSQAYARGLNALRVSQAREGPSAVTALTVANRRKLAVDVKEENLLGLRYHDLNTYETVARSFDERPYDIQESTPWLELTMEEFEEIVEQMLSLASYEGKFRRLAEELIRLTRRIRVLEERVTPELRGSIHAMAQYLAERERETYFRLKRFKSYSGRKTAFGANGQTM